MHNMKIIPYKKIEQDIIIIVQNYIIEKSQFKHKLKCNYDDSIVVWVNDHQYKLKYNDILIYNCQLCKKEVQLKDKTKYIKFKTNEFYCNKCAHEQTNIKRYGEKNVAQVNDIKNKIKETNIKRYGVYHPVKNIDVTNKIRNTKFIYNYEKIINKFKDVVIPLFNIKDYQGNKTSHSGIKYLWKCVKCGDEFRDDIANGTIPRCTVCYPLMSGKSLKELELYDWLVNDLKLSNIVRHDRQIIKPLELDIYLPDYHIAIEFNGLYYHSQLRGNKNKNYHLNKTIWCKNQGIQLLQIYEDEWVNQCDIVKSIIKAKLNLYDQTVYARKCRVFKLNKKYSEFLDDNHIQGNVNNTVCYGLVDDNNNIVSFMGFKEKKKGSGIYELNRFCNRLNYKVIGGFSRLLKYFEREYVIDKHLCHTILTYADLRLSKGDVYLKNDFKLDHVSKPNYYYLMTYTYRYTRQQYMKSKLNVKLDNFDPKLTEWQNLQLNGFDRIWDCGNMVFYKKY